MNPSFTGAMLAFAVAAMAGPALAQSDYPNRPIRLLVGFAAGGPTDIPARFIADKLTDRLGQRVVVENKTGAGGMLATRELLAQPRDGHTLLLCTHFEPINTAVYRNPQFRLADLAPISLTSKYLRHHHLQFAAGQGLGVIRRLREGQSRADQFGDGRGRFASGNLRP
jgi:tripartite-type tricarboxylate transporter receptor subunit TctC